MMNQLGFQNNDSDVKIMTKRDEVVLKYFRNFYHTISYNFKLTDVNISLIM